MTTVLMAVDGTAGAQTARSLYRTMVREPERVILVQVRRPSGVARNVGAEDAWSDPSSVREGERMGSASVTTMVRDGDPSDEVLKVAREENVDLIIMGLARAKGLRRLMSRCAVREVERHALVPVLVGGATGRTKNTNST